MSSSYSDHSACTCDQDCEHSRRHRNGLSADAYLRFVGSLIDMQATRGFLARPQACNAYEHWLLIGSALHRKCTLQTTWRSSTGYALDQRVSSAKRTDMAMFLRFICPPNYGSESMAYVDRLMVSGSWLRHVLHIAYSLLECDHLDTTSFSGS